MLTSVAPLFDEVTGQFAQSIFIIVRRINTDFDAAKPGVGSVAYFFLPQESNSSLRILAVLRTIPDRLRRFVETPAPPRRP